MKKISARAVEIQKENCGPAKNFSDILILALNLEQEHWHQFTSKRLEKYFFPKSKL